MRSTLARWLVVGALAGLGLMGFAASAAGQEGGTTVQGANTADSPESSSGGATTSNDVGTAQAGGGSNVSQDGENEADISQRGSSTAGDSLAGGQTTAISSGGEVNVQMTNNAEDAKATTGEATVTNRIGNVIVGPSGSQGATVRQFGDNELEVSQSATAVSGDAVAGAQIVGVVAAGDISVVLDNFVEEPEATSGEANASNEVDDLQAGPTTSVDVEDLVNEQAPAEAEGSAPVVPLAAVLPSQVNVAQAAANGPLFQEGDNEIEVSQDAAAHTGDAVAGSQVMGLVTSERGNISVSNRQSSDEPTAETGDATAENTVREAVAGPELTVTGEDVIDFEVEMTYIGDAELELSQDAQGTTGGAVAGTQVLGAFSAGGVFASMSNVSEDAEAESGDATAANAAATADCGEEPETVCDAGRLVAGPSLTVEITQDEAREIGAAASLTQVGDDELELDQSADALTGEAVAGAQVVGVVAAGDVSIDVTNTSEDAEAESGDANASNVAANADCEITQGGPSCVAGEIIAGPHLEVSVINEEFGVNEDVEAGDATASGTLDHIGDAELDFSQSGDAVAGDAVAGAQVLGVVAGGNVAVVAENFSEDDEATSGDANVRNAAATGATLCEVSEEFGEICDSAAGAIHAGPLAEVEAVSEAFVFVDADAVEPVAVISGDATATADVTQTGDTELDFSQSGEATAGPAVAGAQVIGVVAGGDIAADVTNVAEDSEATVGDATVRNEAATDGGSITAGPTADVDATSRATAEIDVEIDESGDPVDDDDIVVAGADATSGLAMAIGSLSQTGDNEGDFSQDGVVFTGDAVAGAQVVGLIAGGSVDLLAVNVSEDIEATGGDALVDNAAATDGGIVAIGPTLDVDATSEANVVAELDIVETGGDNNGNVIAGDMNAVSGDAVASGELNQVGDNELDFSQVGRRGARDPFVAGSQVIGVVAGGDATIEAHNVSEDAEATGGTDTMRNAAATNGGIVSAGPVADVDATSEATVVVTGTVTESDAGDVLFFGDPQTGDWIDAESGTAMSAVTLDQTGDNELDFEQVGTDNTAAVAGTISAGPVASSDALSRAAITVDVTVTESGDGGVFFGSPTAVSDTATSTGNTLTQTGDNELDFSQSGDLLTGDAVAGSQVIGAVAGGDVAILATNVSEDAEANVADAAITNTAATEGGTVSAGAVLNATARSEAEVTFDLEITEEDAGDVVVGGPTVESGLATANDNTLTHTGDTELDFSQDGSAASGDAVAGSQIAAALAGGDVTIHVVNTSEDNDADGGDASVTNVAASGGTISSGPVLSAAATSEAMASSELDINESGTGNVTVLEFSATSGEAQASGNELTFVGDSELDFSQSGRAVTGDAVAGAQVVGSVAGGNVAITAANRSEDDEATSGDASVTNSAATNGGTISSGALLFAEATSRATVTVTGTITEADDGVVSVAGFLAESGTATANDNTASQTGDAELDFSQSGSASSGDAVAGAQTVGVVASGDVAIHASNVSEDADAESGTASVTNVAADGGSISAGARVDADATSEAEILVQLVIDTDAFEVGDALAEAGDAVATGNAVSQTGDAELDFSQSGSASSGDAVAGAQVFGVVASGDVAIHASNVSEDADADSGDATVTNVAATSGGTVTAGAAADVDATSVATAIVELELPVTEFGTVGTTTAIAGDAEAEGSATQTGDAELDFSQSGSASSGDVVAGAQVFGVVAGGDVAIVAANVSEDAEADSGDATVTNVAGTEGGFLAVGATADITAASIGEASGPGAEIEVPGTAEATGFAAQFGDNELDTSQRGSAFSGDAVAGTQVVGVVTDGFGAVNVDNTSTDDTPTSGDTTESNTLGLATVGVTLIATEIVEGGLVVLP